MPEELKTVLYTIVSLKKKENTHHVLKRERDESSNKTEIKSL